MTCEIIEDITEDNMRKIFFSCDKKELVNNLINSDLYLEHTNFGPSQTTITLCSKNFLQSIDVIPDVHPDKNLNLNDFMVKENKEDKNELETITSVILYPYVSYDDLSDKTGRDYMKEMDECINFVKKIAKEM